MRQFIANINKIYWIKYIHINTYRSITSNNFIFYLSTRIYSRKVRILIQLLDNVYH